MSNDIAPTLQPPVPARLSTSSDKVDEGEIRKLHYSPISEKAELSNEDYEPPSKKSDLDLLNLDPAARLLLKSDASNDTFTQEDFDKVKKKIDLRIMPLMMLLYFIQFADKTSLGSSAILGIKEDNHLDTTQFNLLGTAFYIAYLAFEYPQQLLLQRFPVGRVLTANVLLWSLFLLCHIACSSFGGLMVLRLGLGACEGAITAGFLISSSQFYTHSEQATRVSYWFLCNGTAQIVSGMLSYGAQFITIWRPWKWFILILGLLTLLTGLLYAFFFPDNPATAGFLTERERVIAIRRIEGNHAGTENKVFKIEQMWEALRSWPAWLFFFFAAFDNIPNSLTNQKSIIINELGYNTLQTSLLTIPPGVIEIVTIFTGAWLVKRFENSLCWVSLLYFIPTIVSSLLLIVLPESNSVGKLISLFFTGVGTTGFVLGLSWCNTSVAGHTKKITMNTMLLIGYCLGNLAGNTMWKEEYKPKNVVPWSIILFCYILCPVILFIIRVIYKRENDRRDALKQEGAVQNGKTEIGVNDGEKGDLRARIDDGFLDLTDKSNLHFRYPL